MLLGTVEGLHWMLQSAFSNRRGGKYPTKNLILQNQSILGRNAPVGGKVCHYKCRKHAKLANCFFWTGEFTELMCFGSCRELKCTISSHDCRETVQK